MKKPLFLLLFSIISTLTVFGQGTLSGDLMTNVNFYQRDSTILTPDNSLYNDYLSGGESWLSLRYNYKGFTAFLRADAFHNSNLYDPKMAISGFGIGAWSLSKDIKGLQVTAGYIYDQIGSYDFLGELQGYYDSKTQEPNILNSFNKIQELIANAGVKAHYRNYPDINFKNWQYAYYGNNYAKLQQLKTKYDSSNIFRYAQGVEVRDV